MPPVRAYRGRLLCPHPNCPITFKSQRGQTHHIRTVHLLSLNRRINVQRDQEHEDNNHHWELEDHDYDHHHQSVDGPDDTSTYSTHSRSQSSVSESSQAIDDLGLVGQRNEHPNLTGMWAV